MLLPSAPVSPSTYVTPSEFTGSFVQETPVRTAASPPVIFEYGVTKERPFYYPLIMAFVNVDAVISTPGHNCTI